MVTVLDYELKEVAYKIQDQQYDHPSAVIIPFDSNYYTPQQKGRVVKHRRQSRMIGVLKGVVEKPPVHPEDIYEKYSCKETHDLPEIYPSVYKDEKKEGELITITRTLYKQRTHLDMIEDTLNSYEGVFIW